MRAETSGVDELRSLDRSESPQGGPLLDGETPFGKDPCEVPNGGDATERSTTYVGCKPSASEASFYI